jgi:hypothetical protein
MIMAVHDAGLKSDDPRLVTARRGLHGVYDTYVNTVSSQGMALSLESSALLWVICDIVKPESIVDLGSGFSSYALREWAKMNTVPDIVTSVDDDAKWLEKSKAFCESQDVPVDNFQTWDDFKPTSKRFDLVIYDLGRRPVRDACMREPFRLVNPSGVILVDDMHWYNYSKDMAGVIAASGREGLNMREATTDPHEGRHSWVVLPPGPSELRGILDPELIKELL